MESATWWLRAGESIARRVTPAGLVIGRSPRCDVVLPSERVSRRQALVYLAAAGPRLEVLGRGPTKVGGEVVVRSVDLAPGDRIEVGGLALEVARETHDAPRIPPRAPVWVLEDPSGALFGMVQSPFLVGGSPEDDLKVAGWPPGALCFRSGSEGALELEGEVELRVDGEPIVPGMAVSLRRGATVELLGSSVRVVTGGAFASGSTGTSTNAGACVRAVQLEFLPRGGRLSVELDDGAIRAVYLADRRCDLVAVLLQPPEPHAPGEFLEDELVVGRVWGRAVAGRTNLNVLLHRVRKDLGRAGLDGARLIERSEGGGATRFVLAPEARVELR